eukprot:scaffold147209_cov26-Tisochrysis_lutea.AAC.2
MREGGGSGVVGVGVGCVGLAQHAERGDGEAISPGSKATGEVDPVGEAHPPFRRSALRSALHPHATMPSAAPRRPPHSGATRAPADVPVPKRRPVGPTC